MNKTYKIVKNRAGASQVAGELAKGTKKGMLLAAIGVGMMTFGAQAAAATEVYCTLYEYCFGSYNENDSGIYFANQDTAFTEKNKYITGFFNENEWDELKISKFTLEVSNVDKNIKWISAVDLAIKKANVVEITNNKAIVNNSSANDMSGAVIHFSGKGVNYHFLENNSIELNDGSKATNVYGAVTRERPETEGYEILRNNSVTINNSSTTNIYGAAITKGEYSSFFFNSKTILTGNSVSINGDSEVTGQIYGGFIAFDITEIAKDSDIVTGNTFNFNNLEKGTKEVKVAEMGNFEHYNVYLQESGEHYFKENGAKDKALITVTEKFGNQLSANQNLDLAKANLWIENQAFTKTEVQDVVGDSTIKRFYILSMGDNVEYVTGDSLEENLVINKNNDSKALNLGENTFAVGTIYSLETELKMDDNSVYLEIAKVGENEIEPGNPDPNVPNMILPALPVDKNAIDRNSPVLDSKIAALSVLNSGNDLSNDILINIEPTQQGEIIAFGKVSGEHNKAKGTSDIHINGVNAILGTGVSLSDKTIIGGYFEYGYGHYDSTRDFDGYKLGSLNIDAMHYKGKGNANYQGLGALFKTYVNEEENVYINVGAKIGLINTNYSSTSFTDYDYRATNMDYSKRKLYVGAQVGTGLKTQLSENTHLNSSINFIYSQIGGNSFVIDDSEIKLNKVKSERLVWTEALKYYLNENVGVKLSGALDYEFSAISKGTIDGYNMTDSSLRGASVVLGTGILFTPFTDKENQYFDLSFNAKTGKNQSLGGSLSFNYNF